MVKINCNFIDSNIKQIAKELSLQDTDVLNYINAWQSEFRVNTYPTTIQLKEYINQYIPIEYVDTFSDGRLTSSSKERTIKVKNNVTVQEFFDYFNPSVEKDNNPQYQKTLVLEALSSEGYSLDRIKSILYNQDRISQFLIEHERSHILNNDRQSYYTPEELGGVKNWLSKNKIDIETRATIDALRKVEQHNIVDPNVLSVDYSNISAKVNREFNSIERQDRINLIARMFSQSIDTIIDTELDKLNQSLIDGIVDPIKISSDIELFNDPIEGRKKAISKYTIEKIIGDIYNELLENSLLEEEDFISEYGDVGKGMKESYKKLIDNFYPLLQESLILIEQNENLRFIIDKHTYHNNINTQEVVGGYVEDSIQDTEVLENELTDNDEGSNIDLGGWSFKVKFINPYNSLSKDVRKILSNIVKLDSNNNEEVDDLGNLRYLSPGYSYSILISHLSEMIESNDFSFTDNTGNTFFPALEKISSKYPWVNQIISTLQDNPSYVSSFYTNFRKDFVSTWMFKDGTSFSLNSPIGESILYNKAIDNYEQGIILSKYSIYNTSGSIVSDNILPLSNIVNNNLQLLRNYEDIENEEFINSTILVLNSLGFNVEHSTVQSLLDGSEDDIDKLSSTLRNIKYILDNVNSLESKSHLIDSFSLEYKTISKLLNEITEFDVVQSFRQGDKTYYSYNAPNMISTQIKYLKSDKFHEYIDTQFKQIDWFYNKVTNSWRSPWLHTLESNSNVRDNLEIRELNNINNVEYKDWRPSDIRRAFISQYFSVGYNSNTDTQLAWYNYPIFADSPVVKFIKFERHIKDFKNKILDGLAQVIKQELYRIDLVQQRNRLGISTISNFDTNGNKFHFFPELNSSGFIDKYNELIKSGDISSIDNLIKEELTSLMNDLFITFYNSVSSDISTIKQDLIDNQVMSADGNIQDYLEEYFWNQTFATTQIIQLTVTDLAYFKDAVDFQKRYKQVYAAGSKLNTNSKYGKKEEKTIYITDEVITSNTFYNIQKVIEASTVLSPKEKKIILDKYLEVNVADAQAYRSPKAYRSVLDMLGQWTPQMEATMERFLNGTWDYSDFNTIFQTIKPFMYTQIIKEDGIGGTIKIPHQNKNSEFLLMATFDLMSSTVGKSPKLKAIHRYMEDMDIDVVQFESAVKAGKEGVVDLNYNPNKLPDNISFKDFKSYYDKQLYSGKISQEEYNDIMSSIQYTEEEVYNKLIEIGGSKGSLNNNVVHTLNYEDYIIQQPTPEHIFDTEAVFGSQFRNLIISDLPDDPSFTITIGDNKFNKKELMSLYDSLIVENLIEGYSKTVDKFSSIETLQNILLEQVKGNPKYGRDIVSALELVDVVHPVTGVVEKQFNIPLDNPTTTDKLQELLTSMFKNAVAKQKIKGGNGILVSNYGLTDQLSLKFHKDGRIKYAECYLPATSKKFYTEFIDEQGLLDISKLPLDLRKAVGYRIPTEDKYSMIPLMIKGFLPQQNGSSIMLPADITTISGADFDVDKMFLMFPEFQKNESYQKLENNLVDNLMLSFNSSSLAKDITTVKEFPFVKVQYDLSKTPQEQSLAARNNMIIDIAYGILTSKDTASKILSPGNFDTIKKSARINTILKDSKQLEDFKNTFNLNSNNSIIDFIKNVDLETLDLFIKKYPILRSPLTIDTFIYNHYQNMTGGALIGIYANNTTAHSKIQNTNVAIKDVNTFIFNDRKIQSISDIFSPLGERISKNCAEFSAASVDNVKDPVLADLMQNKSTASIAGAMLRMGLSIEEVGLMFSIPDVVFTISTFGDLNKIGDVINSNIIKLKNLGVSTSIKDILSSEFNSDDIYNLILDKTQQGEVVEIDVNYLYNSLKYTTLMAHIVGISKDINSLTRISKIDSPTNAIKPSIAKAKNQVQGVKAFHTLADTPGFSLVGVSDIIKTDIFNNDDSIESIREKLLSSELAKSQAFYSLGIEGGLKTLSKYFSQTNKYVDKQLQFVYDNSKTGLLNDKIVNMFYKDLIIFGLTKSTLFGDDGVHSYDEKRNYYLYEYPQQFIQDKQTNPDIANISIIRKLIVKEGVIQLTDSSKLSPAIKDSLISSLDSLLYMDNPKAQQMAIDLFMYAFYKEGLSFGPNNFNMYFSTNYINSFPNYVDTLRQMKYELQEGSYFDKFLPQFYGNRGITQGIIPSVVPDEVLNNSILVKPTKVQSKSTSQGLYNFIFVEDNLYSIDIPGSTEEFIKYNESVSIQEEQGYKYNANMSLLELSTSYTPQDLINKNKGLNEYSANNSISDVVIDIDISDSLDAIDNIEYSYENNTTQVQKSLYDIEDSMSQLLDELC